MKYIAVLITFLLFSVAHAQELTGQCTGDPKKCGASHNEDEHKDEHGHEQEENEAHQDDEKHDENENHKEGGHKHAEDKHDDHGKEEGHEDGEHEESTQVGPDKGILEANEKTGFKLSAEAIKNFKLKFQSYSGGPISLPLDSILQSIEEKNIYRVRNGLIKRIDISIISKSKNELTFTSPELKPGDQIVTEGLGFLRMAELAAFGGAPEGHSH